MFGKTVVLEGLENVSRKSSLVEFLLSYLSCPIDPLISLLKTDCTTNDKFPRNFKIARTEAIPF